MKIIEAGLKFRFPFGENRPENIIIHHALKKHCTVYDVHRWHLAKSWSGCGYHFFIQKDGTIYKARPNLANGAHCLEQNMNIKSIGICLEGCYQDYWFQTDKKVPERQLDSLVELIQDLSDVYNIPTWQIYPHSHFAKKLCPGNYFPWKEFIRVVKANG